MFYHRTATGAQAGGAMTAPKSACKRLFKRLIAGDMESVWALLQPDGPVHPDVQDGSGCTPLSLAVQHSLHPAVVTELLRRGASWRVADRNGRQPLHEAAWASNLHAAEALLNAGADVNALKRGDWSVLHLAATKTSLPMIRLLLDAGADPSLANKDGWNGTCS